MKDLQLYENEIMPIYERTSTGEKVVNARELHSYLNVERDFSTWINQRILDYGFVEGPDFSTFLGKSKGGRPPKEYVLTLEMGKELGMVERNEEGRRVRKYFIEIEKRAKQLSQPQSIEDLIIMQAQSVKEVKQEIELAKSEILSTKEEIKRISSKVDTVITSEDVTASDIARSLNLRSVSGLAHNDLIGAIARKLGFKVGYKHCYQDDYIKVIQDEDGRGHRAYYRPAGVDEIIGWWDKNKDVIYYEDKYKRDGKYGKKGDIKEKGYSVNGVKFKTYLANQILGGDECDV